MDEHAVIKTLAMRTDEGMGVLVKTGLRVFPTDGLFVGGYFKAFTNEQGIRQPSGDTVYVDFGGTVAAFEAGFVF